MKSIVEQIEEAVRVSQEIEQVCLVRNFHLVKVILPTEIAEELYKKTKDVKMPTINSVEGLTAYMCSVPVEVDKNAKKIRYVIEGDIEHVW